MLEMNVQQDNDGYPEPAGFGRKCFCNRLDCPKVEQHRDQYLDPKRIDGSDSTQYGRVDLLTDLDDLDFEEADGLNVVDYSGTAMINTFNKFFSERNTIPENFEIKRLECEPDPPEEEDGEVPEVEEPRYEFALTAREPVPRKKNNNIWDPETMGTYGLIMFDTRSAVADALLMNVGKPQALRYTHQRVDSKNLFLKQFSNTPFVARATNIVKHRCPIEDADELLNKRKAIYDYQQANTWFKMWVALFLDVNARQKIEVVSNTWPNAYKNSNAPASATSPGVGWCRPLDKATRPTVMLIRRTLPRTEDRVRFKRLYETVDREWQLEKAAIFQVDTWDAVTALAIGLAPFPMFDRRYKNTALGTMAAMEGDTSLADKIHVHPSEDAVGIPGYGAGFTIVIMSDILYRDAVSRGLRNCSGGAYHCLTDDGTDAWLREAHPNEAGCSLDMFTWGDDPRWPVRSVTANSAVRILKGIKEIAGQYERVRECCDAADYASLYSIWRPLYSKKNLKQTFGVVNHTHAMQRISIPGFDPKFPYLETLFREGTFDFIAVNPDSDEDMNHILYSSKESRLHQNVLRAATWSYAAQNVALSYGLQPRCIDYIVGMSPPAANQHQPAISAEVYEALNVWTKEGVMADPNICSPYVWMIANFYRILFNCLPTPGLVLYCRTYGANGSTHNFDTYKAQGKIAFDWTKPPQFYTKVEVVYQLLARVPLTCPIISENDFIFLEKVVQEYPTGTGMYLSCSKILGHHNFGKRFANSGAESFLLRMCAATDDHFKGCDNALKYQIRSRRIHTASVAGLDLDDPTAVAAGLPSTYTVDDLEFHTNPSGEETDWLDTAIFVPYDPVEDKIKSLFIEYGSASKMNPEFGFGPQGQELLDKGRSMCIRTVTSKARVTSKFAGLSLNADHVPNLPTGDYLMPRNTTSAYFAAVTGMLLEMRQKAHSVELRESYQYLLSCMALTLECRSNDMIRRIMVATDCAPEVTKLEAASALYEMLHYYGAKVIDPDVSKSRICGEFAELPVAQGPDGRLISEHATRGEKFVLHRSMLECASRPSIVGCGLDAEGKKTIPNDKIRDRDGVAIPDMSEMGMDYSSLMETPAGQPDPLLTLKDSTAQLRAPVVKEKPSDPMPKGATSRDQQVNDINDPGSAGGIDPNMFKVFMSRMMAECASYAAPAQGSSGSNVNNQPKVQSDRRMSDKTKEKKRRRRNEKKGPRFNQGRQNTSQQQQHSRANRGEGGDRVSKAKKKRNKHEARGARKYQSGNDDAYGS